MSELLPCPFCGKKPQLIEQDDSSNLWSVSCLSCVSIDLEELTEERAIQKWNTRHYPPEVEQAIERMKPKKTYKDTDSGSTDHERCSSCNASICLWDERKDYHDEFCWKCGQRLIRSE